MHSSKKNQLSPVDPKTLIIGLLVLILAVACPLTALGEGKAIDPMIRITSLPIDKNVDEIMAHVSQDVSRDTGLDINFITYYWQTFDSIHCPGCEKAKIKKPVFVEVFAPGFMTKQEIRDTMTAVANSLAKHTDYAIKDIFIQTLLAELGETFIMGEVVANWKTVGGPDLGEDSARENTSPTGSKPFLFQNPNFSFQSLWRFGAIAGGGGDLGESVAITDRIEDGDPESWYKSWNSMAMHVQSLARDFRDNGHDISAREAFLRAVNYFRAAEIYLEPNDPRLNVAWKNGRDCFLAAAKLSDGLVEFMEIPFENTTLPAYFARVDKSGKKRPLIIVHTGLDGTMEDFYFLVVNQAVKRGYNVLVFDGPGQGEMIRIKKIPFRHNWETVVTPVVDFAIKLPEVDARRLVLMGYSMGGYLAPRAVAFEHRIKTCVADGGVFSVYDGTMSKFPAEVKEMMETGQDEKNIDRIAYEQMKKQKDLEKFIQQMFWTFQVDSPYSLFQKLRNYTLKDCMDKIKCEMLVLNSSQDQVAGSNQQSKIFYNALKGPKTYFEFTEAEGGQFHCQMGATQISSERIFNWLDQRLKPNE